MLILIISAVIFFLVLSAIPFFLSIKYGKYFEETISISSGLIILFIFLCGLFGVLKTSIYIVIGLSIILICLSLFSLIKNKSFFALKNFITPAFLSFLIVFFVLLFVHYGRLLHEWDEFSHWGDVVKAMTYVDDFSTNINAHSLFQSYVPGMAIFQYLFQKIAILFSGGEFADWRLYFCYHLLAYIFLLPFLKLCKWKQFFSSFIILGCIAMIPSSFQKNYLTSIYIDSFVGLLAGAGFANLFIKKRTLIENINLLVVCSVLVLAKDVGLLFSMILGIGLIIIEVQNRKSKKKLLLIAVLTIATISIPKILWEININLHHVHVKFRTPIDWNTLYRVITFQDHSYLSGIVKEYFRRLYDYNYPILSVLLIVALCTMWGLFSKSKPEQNSQRTTASVLLIFTLVIYLLGLLVIYMFRFGQYEAERLASFERYLSIVYSCFLIAICLMFANYVQGNHQLFIKITCIYVTISLILINPVTLYKYFSRKSVKENMELQQRYSSVVKQMLSIDNVGNGHVWIISQKSDGGDYWPIRYGIRPLNGELGVGWSLSASESSLYEGDIWTIKISAEEWREKLKDYDYVLIYSVDDTFRKDYKSLFENYEEIGNESIFQVNHETEKLVRVY